MALYLVYWPAYDSPATKACFANMAAGFGAGLLVGFLSHTLVLFAGLIMFTSYVPSASLVSQTTSHANLAFAACTPIWLGLAASSGPQGATGQGCFGKAIQ